MTKRDVLWVWYENRCVGTLWENERHILEFQYDNTWVATDFPISYALPLTTQCYSASDGKAHRFFTNLLPEATARAHIVRDLKISDNDFLLLKAIGGECAGALSISSADVSPESRPQYHLLTEDELRKIVLRRGNIATFLHEKNRPRLSLAGAQDKCPIFFDQTHFFLPKGGAPSTHILKFEVQGYSHIPVYEYFLTALAKTIHLPVVQCVLKKIDEHYFLLIERYDRILQNKKITRLHQEDFCQALSVSYAKKYEQDGGPTFLDCYTLIKTVSTQSLVDAENTLKWLIFNVLAGNSDAHAKNVALLYDEKQQIKLAPFYDLVCTRAIKRIDANLAMSVGGQFNPDLLTLKHWIQFVKICDVGESYFKKLLLQLAEMLLNNVPVEIKKFEDHYGPYPALQRVNMVLTKNCHRVLKYLS